MLIGIRSYIFVRYGAAFFDSDQAITGLMARHLSEGRGFPLFFYGQNYMLGVEAWIAAPFFWIGGPTVAMIRAPLVLINVAVGATLVAMFVRRGLAPGFAFIAALPFIATTPLLSVELVTALGACVEPFLYVLLLWGLRHRPAAFGACLMAAGLHREFCVFALPAVALALAFEQRAWSWRGWLLAVAAMVGVWVGVDLLKWHVNTLGIAGGSREVSSLADEARTIGSWLSFEWRPYSERLGSLLTGLPILFGARSYALRDWALDDSLRVGSVVAGVALTGALGVAAGRLAWTFRPSAPPSGEPRRLALSVYLGVIAVETGAAYGLNAGIDPRAAVVARYVLFLLLAPVALVGASLLVERRRVWRGLISALMVLWASWTVTDNVRWLEKVRAARPDSEFRYLAEDLMAHGVRYGWAGYWDAYVVTFLSDERVILASTDKVRISAYQSLVSAHAAEAVTIKRAPCEGGRRVASWCVLPPTEPVSEGTSRRVESVPR